MKKKDGGRRGAIFSVSMVSGVGLFLGVQAVIRPIAAAPCFLVKEVEAVWPSFSQRPVDRFRLLHPTSIFSVNLSAVEQAMRQRYPHAEIEAVRRILPHRIVAELTPRHVVAQIHAGRYYAVAESGEIVASDHPAPWPHLPILYLEGLPNLLRAGRMIRGEEFERACELLGAVRRQRGVAGHQIGSIRSRRRELVVFLDTGLEVRFSPEQIASGMQQLRDLLTQKPLLLEQAGYIDLRFEDPVVGDRQKPSPLKR